MPLWVRVCGVLLLFARVCYFWLLLGFMLRNRATRATVLGNMKGTITVKQAAELTGAHTETILRHIRRGSFSACKPLANKGGWRIFQASFQNWMSDQIGATSNRRPAK